MNANVHFHSLVLDGVFTRPPGSAAPVFQALPPPTDDEVAEVLEQVHARVQRLWRRRGRLPEEPGQPDPVAEQLPLLAGYAAASIQGLVGVVITVPTIAFFVAVQRYLVQGWGAGGVKG